MRDNFCPFWLKFRVKLFNTLAEASAAGLNIDEREELKRLRRQNRVLRMEKEILKKASQYFAKEMK